MGDPDVDVSTGTPGVLRPTRIALGKQGDCGVKRVERTLLLW
jgi:hypothetical protein